MPIIGGNQAQQGKIQFTLAPNSRGDQKTMQTSTFIDDETALSWVSNQFSYKEHNLIREYPWSRIFELKDDTGTNYLKLVPLNQPQVLKTNSILSENFESVIPKTIALNEELGIQLLRHHGGIELDSSASETQKSKVLSTYARMQAKALKNPGILSSIPSLELDKLLTRFIEFFKPSTQDPAMTGTSAQADFFLGSKESEEYYEVLLARKDLLSDFLQNAALLPPTLNHCDLRTENAAENHDGSSIIYDWDDALIGPAGLSLQAFFDGCFNIAKYINADLETIEDDKILQEMQLLQDYITELDKQGYASSEMLHKALPASACAGAMQALLNYADFPEQDDLYIFDVNDYFVRRLDDLLNLCDYLACSNRDDALRFAKDYRERGIFFRAVYIYRQYLETHPNDIEFHKRLAGALNENGKWKEAVECYNTIITHIPDDAETFNELGVTLLKNKHPADAIVKFELALSINPELKPAQVNRDKASELLHMMDLARHPNKLPTVRISPEEKKDGEFSSEKIDLASSLFKKYGALQAESVLDVDMLQSIKQLILTKYASYFEPKEYDDCLRLGDKRHMVTLDIEGPINSPKLYDNPYITPIIKQILGEDYILGAVNIGVSLPGAQNQSIHKDYPPLFDEDDKFRDDLPCFAIGLLIPLVQHSHTVGTTLVIKESQRISPKAAETLPAQASFLDSGSCLMIDYRVGHQGLANTSEDVVRPLLTLIFHRSWFRDCVNYRKQPPIKIDDEIFNTAPERLKELISWAKSEAVINPMKLED
jgi:tetratricopeptide (TPR) repeat protein